MLTIEYHGASALLDLLKKHQQGQPSSEDIRCVLEQNPFFVDFYLGWDGLKHENLADMLAHFNQPDWKPQHPVLTGLSRGFQFALDHLNELQSNLDRLKSLDPSAMLARTAQYLPAGTPIDAVVHFTIDGFNSGFQYKNGIGMSILMFDRVEAVSPLIAHELHHVGFSYWAKRDAVRQAVLAEESGRAAAVRHVQNLLMEGMANYFCSPMTIDREHMPAALVTKLEQFQREDKALLTRAADVFLQAMQPNADYHTCRQACHALMIDLEGIQPAGHYIGARMVEIICQVHPTGQIVACVGNLPEFLPLYNQAAGTLGAPLFDPGAVERFSQIWR